MKICFDTRSIHPHMAPLASCLKCLLPSDNIVYVYRSTPNDPNRAVGAHGLVDDIAVFWDGLLASEASKHVLESDVLIENHRDFDIMEERGRRGLLTIYQSERWFKPIKFLVAIPGFFRIFLPFGIKRAIRMMRLFRSNKKFYYFPLGEHAARDMARMCGLMNGDLLCLFRAPKIEFENKPCGCIKLHGGDAGKRYCLDRMRMWGYFVPQKEGDRAEEVVKQSEAENELKILWVGRMLALKNVDIIIKAVLDVARQVKEGKNKRRIRLDIYGDGPEESRLKKLAKNNLDIIRVYPSVPYSHVRKIMKEHDVYVFCSNELEGWGAVVNEAIEEGMLVLSSSAAGASVMLPKECLFKHNDYRRLSKLLCSSIPRVDKELWTAKSAAGKLKDFIGELS